MGTPISRLTNDSTAQNTLNQPPPIPIYLQMSPDAPQGDVRGISGVTFQVLVNGSVAQSGTTPQNGRIDVRVPPGGTATLQLLVDSKSVAEYEITVDTTALDPVNQVQGQQERLRLLGYQIGDDGPDGNGVNGTPEIDDPNDNTDPNAVTEDFERSTLDFQADQGLVVDGVIGAKTRPKLTSRAGA